MSGGRTAMTQSHSVHGGALSFMSCTSGRESSPLDENDSHQTSEFKTETKKKRFHPLRNLRRMFRRKTRHSNASNESYNMGSSESAEIATSPLEQRSCSTSKLAEENGMQNLMKNNRLAPGLSLSHDSVFTPDRADSGLSSSDLENSSLSISNFVPPPMECPLKSHSSCSESSLLSMDSSEAELSPTVIKSDLDLGITSYKLSHSAAKHKMAVKPKRNHGAPRSRRRAVNSKSPLPSTPEVNEEAPGLKGFPPNGTDFFTEATDLSPTSKPSSPMAEPVPEKSAGEYSTKPVSKSYDSDFVLSKIVRGKPTGEQKQEENYGGVASKEIEAEEGAKQRKGPEEQGDVSHQDDDDWGDRDDEVSSRKEESFFGRLLSRRSEKKKKGNAERSAGKEEASGEETAKTVSPVRETGKGSGGGRNVTRRQRVEPIEIPSSPSLLKKGECESAGRNVRENCNRMKISYSMSPPKSVLPNPIVSRSSSPPKVIWPEHFSHYKSASQKEQSKENPRPSESHPPAGETVTKSEGRVTVHEDSLTKIRRDLSPIVSKTKETQKIIADEVESKFKLLHALGEERSSKGFEASPAKDDAAKVTGHEKNGEFDKFKGKRSQSREEDSPGKSHATKLSADTEKGHGPFRRESDLLPKSGKAGVRSNSTDSVEKLDLNLRDGPVSFKSGSTDLFSGADVLITHEEPHYVNLKNILPVLSNYEKVHHGYENVQVIELVKKEKDSKGASEDKGRTKEGEDAAAQGDSPVEKKAPKFERPKSMRRDAVDGTPEFMKVQLNRVEPRAEARSEEKAEHPTEKAEPTVAVTSKVKSTLIERRKSELMLTTEAEEKDWKQKVKVLRKQTSFTENALPKKQKTDGSQESSPAAKQETVPSEKTEAPEEPGEVVVMRKKPSASGRGGDDQPELMKVFARRSLKVRESEEIVEEMRRSRDSDKENESVESPKEERKKMIKADPEEKRGKEGEKVAGESEAPKTRSSEEVVIQVTPLKPETGTRKSVFQKYGRSSAAENGKVATRAGQQDKLENGVSSAENRGKTRKEHAILEESKSNKMKEAVRTGSDLVTVSCIKEANAVPEDGSEETGFKRIQQRKAEWERRVQQAAK